MNVASHTTTKLICLRETFSHMARVSGFDPLFSALDNCMNDQIDFFVVPQCNARVNEGGIWQKLWRRIGPTNSSDAQTQASSPFVEVRHEGMALKVLSHLERNPEALVLLFFGENQYGFHFEHAAPSVRKRIVICLHQPPSWLRLQWRDYDSLNGLGAIICLSHEQMEFVSGICTTPTILARHGVCYDFFQPCAVSAINTPPRLIFVGQWLRDFNTLAEAMELIWREMPETILDCVVNNGARNHSALSKLMCDKRVNWYADISPEKLLELYQQASILFLPLSDAVANNAIVESLATGLPIVSTRIGGVPDYVPEAAGELCPSGDVQAHANAVLRLLQNPALLKEAGATGRKFAEEHLDWRRIAYNIVSDLKHLILK